ncbi:hypothetical protein [Hyphomicrobium sp.]|uniref:hypothetical protein n=1 Tax=Hyphomicrobium sp. TaxID=82 RepID=UPI003F6E6000
MGKKLGKKEALGLILSEVAKLRSDIKALEKLLSGSAAKSKPVAGKAKRKVSKPAAKRPAPAKKQPAPSRRPVLVETGAAPAPARVAAPARSAG